MDDEPRLRSACDRCHSQKLRCTKQQGAFVCNRCSKSKSICVYSPFRQKKEALSVRPSSDADILLSNGNFGKEKNGGSNITEQKSQKRKRAFNPAEEFNVDLDLELSSAIQADQVPLCDLMSDDWSCNSFNTFQDLMVDSNFVDIGLAAQHNSPPLALNLPPFPKYTDKMDNLLQLTGPTNQYLSRSHYEQLSNQASSSPTASACSPSRTAVSLQRPQLPKCGGNADQARQLSAARCIRQLSELSNSLFEHSTTIPATTIREPAPESADDRETTYNRATDYSKYRVDETFRVTQELVDLYPSFLELFTRRKVSRPPNAGSAQTGAEQMLGFLGPVVPPLSNALHLDHSAILLLLSCHLRVLDIYDELFKHMAICIELRGVASTEGQASFTVPQLRIGNYVPPLTTAVPMQMLLLFHFATSLCDFAVELHDHIQQPADHCGSEGSSPGDQKRDDVEAMSLVSAQKVKDRATGMLQRLSSLRAVMLREGHLA